MVTFLRRHWTLFSLATLILGAGWIALTAVVRPPTSEDSNYAPREGFLAPDFTLPTLAGGTASLADLYGKPVLINVWTSWCPPCREEMPAMQRVYEQYGEAGFNILAVNATAQDTMADVEAFVSQGGYTFPVLLDQQGDFFSSYEVLALPTSFFIGRDGTVRKVVYGGPMTDALLKTEVERLLAEEP